MEAHGVREFPPDSLRGRFVRRALQAAVTDVILPAFAEQVLAGVLGASVSRDLASRAHVYLQARTHYGIIDAHALAPLQAIWRSVLGEPDLQALDDLYARLLWIPDGELERLDDAAREYRRIVGEPEPPPRTGGAAQGAGSGEGGGGATQGEDHGAAGDGGANAGTLTDALEQAIAAARADQLEQLDHDVDLEQVIRDAARRASQSGNLGKGRGTGLPTGRMPDRGVDRPPYPDEVQHARRYANRLRQALTHGTRQIDKRTPGGRFDGRAYTRGRAEHAAGRPVTTHPWRITRQVSGSDPGAARRADHRHLRIDGRLRVRARADRLDPHRRPAPDRRPLRDGPVRQPRRAAVRRQPAAGARAGDPDRRRDRVRRRRDRARLRPARDDQPAPPRFVYVLSDGGWSDTRTGVERIRWLAELGVPTIHLSIGIAPLSVECDRITVITDPAQALDHIAADTVAALAARRGRARTH